MTLEQAIEIWVRLETALHALESAWEFVKTDMTAPQAEITLALQYTHDALKICKERAK